MKSIKIDHFGSADRVVKMGLCSVLPSFLSLYKAKLAELLLFKSKDQNLECPIFCLLGTLINCPIF